jgi:hypothetical protein
MEIHNHGKILTGHLPATENARTGSLEPGNGLNQTEQVKPQRLLEKLQGDEKVRDRLLVEIEAKIQAGEYSTRAAAEEAAQQIVGP